MPKTPGVHFGFTRQWILTMMSMMYHESIETGIEFERLVEDDNMVTKIINESNELINSVNGIIPINNITPTDVVTLLNQQL